jgi:hypothetical protein
MMVNESYENLEKQLFLAKLTIELGKVTREKWKQLGKMRDILQQEENLIKEIAEKSEEL